MAFREIEFRLISDWPNREDTTVYVGPAPVVLSRGKNVMAFTGTEWRALVEMEHAARNAPAVEPPTQVTDTGAAGRD